MITPDGVRAAPRGGSSLATALGIMDPMRVGGEKDGRHGGWMLPAAIRRAIALGLGVYVVWLAVAYRYHFIDGVNLLVHEAGHVVFGPFGEVLGTLGGTLLQLFFPLAFLVYFWRRAQRLEAGVCGVWAAENGMYTAEYMADAQAQMLPLVGGHIHDWNWLLGRAGILGACEELGALLHVIASASAISAVWLVARETSLTPRPRARPQTR
jgi:hypothetical protein